MSVPSASIHESETQNVHSLELFFDLVFVFAVSQLTKLVAHPHGLLDYVQAALVFISVTWIYSAFVWLTNNLKLESSELERWSLMLGMICFFGMAVGIPHLAHGSGALLAFSVLAAVVVHFLTFGRIRNTGTAAYARLAPFTFATALLIVFAVFAPAPWRWVLWGLAMVALFLPGLQRDFDRFAVEFRARHFVERHGLMLIIALGEGVVALGAGASDQGFSLGLVGYLLAGLMLLATLWWVYFGMNQHAAEHQLLHADLSRRRRMARHFNTAHTPMLAGIILVAAALEVGVHHPLGHAASAAAWNMAAGLSLFFVGLSLMRWRLNLPTHSPLWVGALLCLATAPLAIQFGSLWQLLAVIVIMLGVGFSRLLNHEQP